MRFATKFSSRELTPLPGCSQVVVSHGAFMLQEHRSKGLALPEHLLALEKAKELNYDYALCTVREDNTPQHKVLEKAGWKLFDTFKSSYTGGIVRLYGKQL